MFSRAHGTPDGVRALARSVAINMALLTEGEKSKPPPPSWQLVGLFPRKERIMLTTLRRITFAAVLICAVSLAASAANLSPSLSSKLATLPNSAGVGVVIVSFNTTSGLNATHLAALRAVGITKGITLQR